MSPKYLLIAIVGVLYVWVILTTWPYRRQVVQNEERTNYFNMIERRVAQAKTYYDSMKENPQADAAELVDAEERYAMLLWEKREFGQAVILLQHVVEVRTASRTDDPYDDKWVKSMLHLGGVYRDMTNFAAADYQYREVLKYDLERKPPDKAKLARDYNNIGLLSYMTATSQEDDNARDDLLVKSISDLKKAIGLWREAKGSDSASEGNSLWNLYLAQRDLGLSDEAERTREAARRIDKLLDRPYKAP